MSQVISYMYPLLSVYVVPHQLEDEGWTAVEELVTTVGTPFKFVVV